MNLYPVLSDVPGHKEGGIEFCGLRMSQNQNGPIAVDAVLKTSGPFKRIIEIGTGSGGLSALFALYAIQQQVQFVTYDIKPCRNRVLTALGVDFRQKSCWDAKSEIAAQIQCRSRTLLFCDGGDKVREFNTFAPYLMPGDVIMAHDYAVTREDWNDHLRGSVWDWCEITFPDIQATCEACGFIPMQAYLCRLAAMCAWRRQ